MNGKEYFRELEVGLQNNSIRKRFINVDSMNFLFNKYEDFYVTVYTRETEEYFEVVGVETFPVHVRVPKNSGPRSVRLIQQEIQLGTMIWLYRISGYEWTGSRLRPDRWIDK